MKKMRVSLLRGLIDEDDGVYAFIPEDTLGTVQRIDPSTNGCVTVRFDAAVVRYDGHDAHEWTVEVAPTNLRYVGIVDEAGQQ